jgi:hypothetical protein
MREGDAPQVAEIPGERLADQLSADFFGKLEARPRLPQPSPIPIPIPWPLLFGSRFMIWKQDPTVGALGRRLAYLQGLILNGPHDSRITTELPGTTPVVRGTNGDFIFGATTPESDCAHAFAVVRETLTHFERVRGGTRIPWAWNTGGNTDPVTVFPHGFTGANAFYSRNQKSLKFGLFTPSGSSTTVFTARSLDIVAHETGHAVLDGLKPGWLGFGNPPQTGGLHESFGDLSAIFLALSQLDQVEALIAITKANLHQKNFLAAVAEQFGSALGRPTGLRNADNDLKLSQVSNEVHALSQVFTGGIYDVLADIFAFEKNRQRATKDPARVLLEVGGHVCNLLIDAIVQAPNVGATYSDVVNKMLSVSHTQGDPAIYRTFIRNRFTFREVVVSATPLTAMVTGQMNLEDETFTDGKDELELAAAIPSHASLTASQDRSGCCGTMQLPEYACEQKTLDAQLKKLAKPGATVPEESLLDDELKELGKEFV